MFGRRWQQKIGPGPGLQQWLEETPVRSLLVFMAIGLFVAVTLEGPSGDRARWGAGSPLLYRQGEVWRLLVSSLHHGSLLHLLFNLLWLVRLGRPLEQAAGPGRMLAFVVGTMLFSGLACELTIEPGAIGLSGVVYAIFGVLWVLRRPVMAFRQALDEETIKIMLVWLFLCIPLTYFNILNIANVGHFSGLLFGVAVGWGCRLWRHLPLLGRIALFLPLLVLPAGLYELVRRPVDPTVYLRAALLAEEPEAQIREYRRFLSVQPGHPAAELKLAEAYLAAGQPAAARPLLEKLLQQDPDEPALIQRYLEALNTLGDRAAMAKWIERLRPVDPEAAAEWEEFLKGEEPAGR